MTAFRVWLARTLDVFLRGRREKRLSEEMQTHLDLLAAEHIARGMPPDQARAEARRAFGGVDQIKETYRDQRGLPAFDALLQDLRFAVRLLWRDPAFTLSAVAVLGLGIGVNNMLFTIVNAHTLRGLPIRDAEQVVFLTTVSDRSPDLGVSFRDFGDWQTRARSFESLAAFANDPVVVAGDGLAPATLNATFVSSTAFATVGTQPILGRDFTQSDDAPGAAAVVMLGSGTWESRYARAADVLGRAITVDGTRAVIVGIMPERSGFPTTAQLWVPLAQMPGLTEQARDARTLRVVGRIRDGVSVTAARAEIETIAAELVTAHTTTTEKVRARVVPVNEQFQGSLTHPAWRAFMAVGMIVVAISCANAANLMLARSFNRSREIAIRSSLGASRLRVVRQLCIEGATLAAVGGAVGLGVAIAGVRLFSAGIPAGALPYWVAYSTDTNVLLALVIVSAGTVFLFALVPAIHGSRADVSLVLKDGARTGTARKGQGWSTVFLAAEFGLAVILLAQFVVNVRSREPALPSDTVLETSDVLTAEIRLPGPAFGTAERRATLYAAVEEHFAGVPAVSSASLVSVLPGNGGETRRLEIQDRPLRDRQDPPTVLTVAISRNYFATLGLTLARGREFAAGDGGPGRAFAIVNERFVEEFSPDRNPIGQQIAVNPDEDGAHDPPVWLTIVGVAPSIRQRLTASPDPVVYLPLQARPTPKAVLVTRSRMRTEALADVLRSEMQKVDSTLPLDRMRTIAVAVREATWVGRMSRTLFNVLTFVAVLLAALGLYAVTSYAVSQRTQEIGIRMALGARTSQVIWFVGRRVAFQLAIGLLTGIACTRVWSWMFTSGRAGVAATDPLPIAGVAAILLALAAIACFVPIRRATRLDPVAAIRHD